MKPRRISQNKMIAFYFIHAPNNACPIRIGKNGHLEQFDKAIATALKSLLASGGSRTTPLAL